MKRFRILLAALILMALGTVCAFADIAPNPVVKALPWILYCIPVVIILLAISLLRRAVKRRRSMNDGMDPEEGDTGEGWEE